MNQLKTATCRFYAMMNFVNPGLLGAQAAFSRVFAQPIEASREPTAEESARALGAARMAELSRVIAPYQLRRTAEVNKQYLPPCVKYVVFCKPTAEQLRVYRRVLHEEGRVESLLAARGPPDGTQVLALIGRLRQVCNHPGLAALPPEVRVRCQHQVGTRLATQYDWQRSIPTLS